MANFDWYDRLQTACKSHKNYPANLLRTRSFQHSLNAYNARLSEESDDLFDDDPRFAGVKICEAYDGCGKCRYGDTELWMRGTRLINFQTFRLFRSIIRWIL